MNKHYSIDYTKIAEAESVLFEAKKRIREIDTPLPGEIWGVMEDLDKVTELLREYLSEDNLIVSVDNPDNDWGVIWED